MHDLLALFTTSGKIARVPVEISSFYCLKSVMLWDEHGNLSAAMKLEPKPTTDPSWAGGATIQFKESPRWRLR